LIDLAIATVTFIVFVYVTGNSLPITVLWYPVVFLIELILVIGVVLFGSAINVFARDVKLLLPLIIPLWLFLTPVMYPLESVPSNLRPFYLMNPMTGVVESFRDILIVGIRPEFAVLGPSIVGAVTAIALGIWYFSATERRFADVI
jgi:ABC-type polysaccharide/polyol phosphate export permease